MNFEHFFNYLSRTTLSIGELKDQVDEIKASMITKLQMGYINRNNVNNDRSEKSKGQYLEERFKRKVLECLIEYSQSKDALATGRHNQQRPLTNDIKVIQDIVLNYFKGGTSMTGLCAADIRTHLNQISENEVKQALEQLSLEGFIYSTGNDDHYHAVGN